jgi:Rod binding domain-containing protein
MGELMTANTILTGSIKDHLYETNLNKINFPKNSKGNTAGSLKKTCEDFESLFIAQILKEMRDTIPKSGLVDGGQAEEIYTSLLDSHLSQEIAANGSMGLAQKLYEQLSKLQESTKVPQEAGPVTVNREI